MGVALDSTYFVWAATTYSCTPPATRDTFHPAAGEINRHHSLPAPAQMPVSHPLDLAVLLRAWPAWPHRNVGEIRGSRMVPGGTPRDCASAHV